MRIGKEIPLFTPELPTPDRFKRSKVCLPLSRDFLINKNTVKYFLSVLGMVLIIEGLPYFAFPEKVKEFLERLLPVPDHKLRIIGLGAMVAGFLLIYSTKG